MITYRYNADGQRIYKKVGSMEAEHYIMDGDQNLAVFNENGSLKYWNIFGNGLAGRLDASGDKFYYIKDHLGSTRAVIDNSGTVVEAHDYYPFGLRIPARSYTTGEETKEKFTGKERDSETGLDYFGARYYWPAGGRWLAVDPLAEKYPEWSPYNYTLNNPINNFDPDGREVVFSDSIQAAQAAQALNEVNQGADIRVEPVKKKHSFLGLFSWTTTSYKLSTAGSSFDWSQNKYTSGLFDVINSKEVIFNVSLVDGKETGWPISLYDAGGGKLNSYQGGGDAIISNTGNRVGDPLGVVLMHELVGHGHPVGGSYAHDINKFYQTKLGYEREPYGLSHPGYHQVIGWKKTGLYSPPPSIWPYIKPRHY